MAKKPGNRVARAVAEFERSAKKLRGETRKRVIAAPMMKSLQKGADQLRERVVTALRAVEEYVHGIRVELGYARSRRPAAPHRRHPRPRRRGALASR